MRLLQDQSKMDVAKRLVQGSPELERKFIDILVSLKNVKGAIKCVKDFG